MNHQEAMQLFGLYSPCSQEELRMIWRKLALKNHPDRFSNCSSTVVDEQTTEMARINEAYKLLLEIFFTNNTSDFFEDVFSFYDYFSGYEDFFSIHAVKIVNGNRVKRHPDHKSGVYNELWNELTYMKNREGLKLRCWEKAIFQLLPDLKRYPDIDGIIHNYIRDCSGLLMRLGLFEKAFELVALVAELGCQSYYEFYPASQVAYKSIAKSSKYDKSIPAWENAILGKLIFEDIRVHWAMLFAYYSHGQYASAIENVEKGFIIPISSLNEENHGRGGNEIKLNFENKPKLIKDEFDMADRVGMFTMGQPLWTGLDVDTHEKMFEDIKCILINCLDNLGCLNNGSTEIAEERFPYVAEIIQLSSLGQQEIDQYKSQTIKRTKYQRNMGLCIIENPDMDYLEIEIINIWEKYFAEKLRKQLAKEKRAKKVTKDGFNRRMIQG